MRNKEAYILREFRRSAWMLDLCVAYAIYMYNMYKLLYMLLQCIICILVYFASQINTICEGEYIYFF